MISKEKIERWTVNNARYLKLSIILAKLKDFKTYVSCLSTLLQYLLQDIVRKIKNNQKHTCNFNIKIATTNYAMIKKNHKARSSLSRIGN